MGEYFTCKTAKSFSRNRNCSVYPIIHRVFYRLEPLVDIQKIFWRKEFLEKKEINKQNVMSKSIRKALLPVILRSGTWSECYRIFTQPWPGQPECPPSSAARKDETWAG